MSACSFPINPLDYRENYYTFNIRKLTSMCILVVSFSEQTCEDKTLQNKIQLIVFLGEC